MVRGQCFGQLTDVGKKEYAAIFPDGKVPLQSIFPITIKAINEKEETKCYRIDLQQLSQEQKQFIINRIATRENALPSEIEKSFEELGFIPIRSELLSIISTTNPAMFMPDVFTKCELCGSYTNCIIDDEGFAVCPDCVDMFLEEEEDWEEFGEFEEEE